ncbi:antibiotic biosynthesis monooxygenase family protein [Rhodoplanes sp. Z2-YC6860]|uniref:antibiotic biosynthesis monooxygenase family protein n=1 Tax=Rhodoplanes sp. Z2-YC6860 TaxID=674703 RepID=UPI00078EB5E5|nr:antibiotic biosynthesis monooxygenase [Rhodoplanes sp. Z2-YC6860]AMN42616.1 Antibiotic biosynthesis monooxygenase [Rhodoplanes sp. Z2-YC6860]
MFAVIFEVQPKQERFDEYLELAKGLKPKLEAIDGFIDNERFKSLRDQRRLVSLSTWRDEKAVIRWRTQGEHHGVQEKGRFEVFEDYHLRVGEIFVDSQAPATKQLRFDETEIGAAKVVSLTEVEPKQKGDVSGDTLGEQLGLGGHGGLIASEIFESIYVPGKLLLLTSWRDAQAAEAFPPRPPAGAKSLRHRSVRIIRDYGMFERREAPQFYPEVRKAS